MAAGAQSPPPSGLKSAEAKRGGEQDARFMRLALSLGRRGLGRTGPNPAVGCVIVKDGVVVGRGWTQSGGRPHAEVEALRRAGDAARGATAYVTLEPCAHHGVTPPCVEALSAAGVVRVVSALEDPDPRVAGRGHAILKAGGVLVDVGVLAKEAETAHRGYLARRRRGRPTLTLKLGATIDGRIATARGESQWITSPPARDRAHLLRVEHDAILVGSGTALTDDPRLDARLPGLAATSPIRVVADRRLSLPLDGKLAASAPTPPLWLWHGSEAGAAKREALEARGAVLIEIPTLGGAGAPQLDLAAGLAALGARGVNSVLCEGGGRMAASLIAADLVDRLICVTAGVAIGGDGLPAIGGLGLDRLGDAPRFALERLEPIGPDVLSEWRRVGPT